MKRSLLAMAVLAAFAGGASAQSSVTIGGIVDLAVRNVENKPFGRLSTLSPEGMQSNRLIVRAVEDLGGGLRAGFWLEAAISPDNGGGTASTGANAAAGGLTWARRSTLSLIGPFGEIRLGRDYTPTFWNHTLFDPFNTVGVAAQTNLHNGANPLGSGASTFTRANNTVAYFLPPLGGLYGQVTYAFDEVGGAPNAALPAFPIVGATLPIAASNPAAAGGVYNEYYGGRIGYAAGPVNVAVAYGVTVKNGGMVDDLNALNVGGSFNIGFMTLIFQYHTYEYGAREQENFMGAFTIPFGANTVKFSYGESRKFREATQIGVGYQYDLSKRTALYANASQVDNEFGSNYTASGSGYAVQGPNTGNPTGFKSTGVEFGVRHAF
ncbi:MAG: porin [Chitinophagaceae bacterium]|nr:porin [Rubrivivax sp.]